MALYLIRGSYTADAIKAMVAEPQDREVAARAAMEALGGTMHCFYFAFGEHDLVSICEFADDKTMAAASFLVTSTGAFSKLETTKLLTTAEAKKMLAGGSISGGMIPKVETCINAIQGETEAAHILDGRVPHVLLLEVFTEHGVGTMIKSK